MTPTLRAATVLAGLGIAAAAQAEGEAFEATVSLPRLSQQQGQSLAWRELTLRAERSAFSLELRRPSCLAQDSAPAGQRCAAASSSHAEHTLSRALRGSWQGDALWPGGPGWQLSGSAWHSPGHGGQAPDHGSDAEWALNQALGPWALWLGHSQALTSATADGRWRSLFGGLEWQAKANQRLELGWDGARHPLTGERDRTAWLRWRVDLANGLRASVQALRQLDDGGTPWRLGAGLDWRF